MNKEQTTKNPMALALDIGTTKVCAIAGRINEYDKLEIVGIGVVKSEGVNRGVVSNINKTVKSISEAIQLAEEGANTKFTKVHVGIAGQHIKSVHHRGLVTRPQPDTEISEEDINKLITDMHKLVLPPGDKILHVFPQEFTVDAETKIIDPIGMSGVRLEANFHVITGQLGASRDIIKCVERVGKEVADITLEPIASSKAVLCQEEKDAGVALVDIGGGTTDITIFKDGIIRHTSVIPFGGNVVTNDIKEGCMVMADQAEKLKVKFGSALADEVFDNRTITIPGFKGRDYKEISEKNLAMIIEARLEEIFDYVLWEIKRSGYEDKLIAGIVLTGGGSLLKNIEKLSEYYTGLPTRIGQPIEHLAHGYTSRIASPIYSTAVGLLGIALSNIEPVVAENEVFNLDEDGVEDGESDKFLDKILTFTRDFFASTSDTDF